MVAPVLVDPPAFAIYDVDFRVGHQVAGRGADGARQKRVVGIEPDEDLAARLKETAVRGVRRPLVLAGETADAVAVAGQNSRRFVGGSAIHYDDFDIGVVLGEDAFQGFREITRHIERRRNYGNQGKGGEIHSHAPLYQHWKKGPS